MANGLPADPNQMVNIDPEQLFGPENLTTTAITDLPDWLKPYATGLLERAQQLSTRSYPYPQRAGQAATLGYAQGSGPMVNMADRLAMATMGGAYLYPETNPYLAETYKQGARAMTDEYKYATAPTTAANFARAGAFGGSAMDQEQEQEQFGLGENLASLANAVFGGNYQTERQRQYGQQTLTPGILEQRYIGPQQMMNVGGQQQSQTQSMLNTAYQNAYNRADWPYKSLGVMEGALNPMLGTAGGSTTTTSPNPNYSSPFADLVGLGLINANGSYGYGGGSAFPGVRPGAAPGFGTGYGF